MGISREVSVVADPEHRLADGGIDQASGDRGGAERDLDRLHEKPVDRRPCATGVVHARDVRIRPEAAARAIDVVELGADGEHGGVEIIRVGDDHGRGPEGGERRRGGTGHQEPPDVTGGGAWTGCEIGGATGARAPPSPVGGSATR